MHPPPSASASLRRLSTEDPHRPALVTAARTWSYAELHAAVERRAAWLVAAGLAGGGGMLALRFRGTVELIVTSLAAARTGTVCSSIDPLAPVERVELLVADLVRGWSGADRATGRVVLVTDEPAGLTDLAQPAGPGLVEVVDVAAADSDDLALLDGAAEAGVDELQSVIYTSGSTGTPVGLRFTGRQRIALDAWAQTLDVFGDGVRVGQISAGTLGQASEFPRLSIARGATIVVHEVLSQGLTGIPEWLAREQVAVIGLVPTLVRLLLPQFAEVPAGALDSLRSVVVWGEQSDWETTRALAALLDPEASVHNVYATTETGLATVFSDTARALAASTPSGPLPAGRPAAGVTVRIVGEDGSRLPDGERGELLIASAQVSAGHWGRPELTAAATTPVDGVRFWRTGDEAWLEPATGDLHVVGRLDDIVKVAGHRLSLGEVERAARRQSGVEDAVATAVAVDGDEERIHLYVTTTGPVDVVWLRRSLARLLPPVALPQTVTVLEQVPTLPNGKVDRRALPAPVSAAPTGTTPGAVPSGGDPGVAVALDDVQGWFTSALGAPVGPDDDFFDLGGDSLRAARLVATVQHQTGVDLSPTALFEAPTPRLLAQALRTEPSVLVPVRASGDDVPLFVVHGAGSDAWYAHPLALALPDAPVYALQPPPLRGPTPFAPDLHSMAATYVDHVRAVRPHGPYRLFGYSLGGLVAFEMAVLLQEAGEEVALLALGDTPTPDDSRAAWLAKQARAADGTGARAVVRDPAAAVSRQVTRVRRRLARPAQRHWRAFAAGDAPHPDIRGDAYARTYRPLVAAHRVEGRYAGDLLLVRASGADHGAAPDYGWGEHVSGAVQVVVVDCGHQELVKEPAVRELARAVAAGVR